MISALSWLMLAGFAALVVYGLRTGRAWAHVPGAGEARTELAGWSLLYLAALFLFAWAAPSANPIFRLIANGGNVIAAILAVVGIALVMLGR